MQLSAAHCSISTARVSQRRGRLVASFQSSIHGKDARANDALWIHAALVVAGRTPTNVTHPAQLFCGAVMLAAAAADYGLLSNPLMAFHSVRAGFSGPVRATRTGTFARFKMLRVRSPMM